MKINLKPVKTKNTLEEQYSKVLEEKHEFLKEYINLQKNNVNKDKLAEEACDYLQALKTYSDMRIINPKYRYDDVNINLDIKNHLSIFNVLNNDSSGLGIFCRYLFNFLNNCGVDVEKAWENHIEKMDSRNWEERILL